MDDFTVLFRILFLFSLREHDPQLHAAASGDGQAVAAVSLLLELEIAVVHAQLLTVRPVGIEGDAVTLVGMFQLGDRVLPAFFTSYIFLMRFEMLDIYLTKALKDSDSRHSVFSFTLGYKFAL